MSKRKTKYTLRGDGRIVTSKLYPGIPRKFFYGRSDEEVERKIRDFEDELDSIPPVPVPTFADVADAWWEKKEPTLSPNSITSYAARLKEAKEEFGDAPIDGIEQWQILEYLNRKAAQGYAQKGITNRRSLMKSIFDYAVADKDIPVKTNPCAYMAIVKGKKAGKRRPASDEDIVKLEELKTGSLIARMFYFMEYSGCRIGEASVLQQKDVDLEEKKARITKDIAFRGQKPEVKDCPKTEAGDREIDLYDNVIEILPHYKDPDTFLFFPDGLPTKSRWEKAINDFRKESGITATAHQLRHTYAGIMHSAEVDVKDAQARLGHSSIAMTQDVYTEIERAYNAKVRDKVNSYVMGERLKKAVPACPACGSLYTKATDGHTFTFCPDCGHKLT